MSTNSPEICHISDAIKRDPTQNYPDSHQGSNPEATEMTTTSATDLTNDFPLRPTLSIHYPRESSDFSSDLNTLHLQSVIELQIDKFPTIKPQIRANPIDLLIIASSDPTSPLTDSLVYAPVMKFVSRLDADDRIAVIFPGYFTGLRNVASLFTKGSVNKENHGGNSVHNVFENLVDSITTHQTSQFELAHDLISSRTEDLPQSLTIVLQDRPLTNNAIDYVSTWKNTKLYIFMIAFRHIETMRVFGQVCLRQGGQFGYISTRNDLGNEVERRLWRNIDDSSRSFASLLTVVYVDEINVEVSDGRIGLIETYKQHTVAGNLKSGTLYVSRAMGHEDISSFSLMVEFNRSDFNEGEMNMKVSVSYTINSPYHHFSKKVTISESKTHYFRPPPHQLSATSLLSMYNHFTKAQLSLAVSAHASGNFRVAKVILRNLIGMLEREGLGGDKFNWIKWFSGKIEETQSWESYIYIYCFGVGICIEL